MFDLAGTEDSHASSIAVDPPLDGDRAGTLQTRCPHSTRVDASPSTCSLCVGITVERIRPRDDAEAFEAALAALHTRGRARLNPLPQSKRQPRRATTAPKNAPHVGPDEMLGGDVARALGVSRQRVSQLASQLGAERRGHFTVFSRRALDAYIAERAERARTDRRCRSRGTTDELRS